MCPFSTGYVIRRYRWLAVWLNGLAELVSCLAEVANSAFLGKLSVYFFILFLEPDLLCQKRSPLRTTGFSVGNNTHSGFTFLDHHVPHFMHVPLPEMSTEKFYA